jgi:hypothetical protein
MAPSLKPRDRHLSDSGRYDKMRVGAHSYVFHEPRDAAVQDQHANIANLRHSWQATVTLA